MGCFDTVYIACPKCGHRNEVQSKAGECLLTEYELHDCPIAIMGELLDDSNNGDLICERCGVELKVTVEKSIMVRTTNAGKKLWQLNVFGLSFMIVRVKDE